MTRTGAPKERYLNSDTSEHTPVLNCENVIYDIWNITHMCTEMNQFTRNGFPAILLKVELRNIKICV